ncbi:MAG: PAS domain S-box protein, partial [Gallionellaceae bacterium]|nr:PAS domain S-box protein [Gallionellaceae bacterium]
MRIRVILIAAAFTSIVMGVALAFFSYSFSQRLSVIAEMDERGRANSRTVGELLVLTNEYALYGENRAAKQWKAQYATLMDSLYSEDVVQDKLMREQATLLLDLFTKLEEVPYENLDSLQRRRKEFLFDQLLNNVRSLSEAVYHLSERVNKQRIDTEHRSHQIATAIPLIMLVIVVLLSWLLKQRVLKPLNRLHTAVLAIGKGDLSVRAASVAKDELGELSRAFNTMAVDMVSELRAEVAVRQQAESRLAQSELRLTTIIETEPECIKIVDAEGILKFMNPAGLVMIEADSLAQVAGRGVLGIIAPDYRDAFSELHKKVIAGESGLLQFEIIGLKGGHRWLETHAVPLRDNGTTQLLSITRDITLQKLTEEKLKLAASVFTHAREGIMITDPIGTIIDVNDTFCKITDFTRDEVLGKNTRMLSSGRHGAEYYAKLWEELLQTDSWQGEIWNRRKSGEVYAEMQTISAVRDEQGNIKNYVSLFSDITSLKEHETQLEHIAH